MCGKEAHDSDVECVCQLTCPDGHPWGEQEDLSSLPLTIHSHTPVTDVSYFTRSCSNPKCMHVLHPDGLHDGLLIMKHNNGAHRVAYDHELLLRYQDDFEIGGDTDRAAFRKLKRSYQRLPIALQPLLPSDHQVFAALKHFRALIDEGRHLACMEDGVDNLFCCPICGDGDNAPLVADGTASE